jgi:hypothetical protein
METPSFRPGPREDMAGNLCQAIPDDGIQPSPDVVTVQIQVLQFKETECRFVRRLPRFAGPDTGARGTTT